MTPAEQLKEQVLTLQAQLLEANPNLPTLLRTIHNQLRADSSLVTTLDEEAIGIIVSGLAKQQMTTIATSITKGNKGKSLKQIELTDL